MEECRRMGTKVLGPDVNESAYKFTVNKNREIRFGLGALKGVGEGAVEAIVNERKNRGEYTSIFDVTRRVNLRSANKKAFESMALAGAFDSFEHTHRAQYFHEDSSGMPFLEKAIKFGASFQEQENAAQGSLFGGDSTVQIPEPTIPECEEWGRMEKLSKEKSVVGIYLSGHPLDDFQFEIKNLCTAKVKHLNQLERYIDKGEMRIPAIVTDAQHRVTKNGKPFGILQIEGYQESHQMFLFGDDYVKFKPYLNKGWFVFIKGKAQMHKWRKETEFKIMDIDLLSEVRDKLSKSITLKIENTKVDTELVELLSELTQANPGDCVLKVEIIDRKRKNVIQLTSRSKSINLNNKVVNTLLNNDHKLDYKLN